MTQILSSTRELLTTPLGVGLAIAALILAIAILGHGLFARFANNLAKRNANASALFFATRLTQSTRWIVIGLALSVGVRAIPMSEPLQAVFQHVSAFILPMLIGWLALSALHAYRDTVFARADISVADNLQARRTQTRIGILTRIGSYLVIFLTICMMLISIPSVRSVGVTLMASAGIVGLAIGAAAQPALKNLIAGIQLAMSEPIRIDDVVIVDGEWGRIEQIHLTYVVILIWDQRRLIVPVSKFLENSFQNWTREGSELLGTAYIYVDPSADVERIRTELQRIVRTNPNWDKRLVGLQVTDLKQDVMELRALVSASDASKAFDLRCDVREALISFVVDIMPGALPKQRLQFSEQNFRTGNNPQLNAGGT